MVTEGDNLFLECTAPSSDPQLTVHWLSPNGSVASSNGTLQIANISAYDTGEYVCVGTVSSINVTVRNSVIVIVQCEQRKNCVLCITY